MAGTVLGTTHPVVKETVMAQGPREERAPVMLGP